MKKLDIIATIKDGVSLALVNYLSVICAALLYFLTIWIPYLNVGTTIAMASLPAEMAKGNVINPLFIFDGKFRRNMGEFFILMSLMFGAVFVGFSFGIIPGIVISYAWYLAVILFVDQDKSALDALRESNRLTYGNKWRIFCAEMLLAIGLGIVFAIINALFSIGEVRFLEVLGGIITFVLILFVVPALIGVEASIYRQLALGDELSAEAPVVEPAPAPAPAPAPKAEPEAPKAAKKPAVSKPAAKKPAATKAEKPAAKKPATRKPAAKKKAE